MVLSVLNRAKLTNKDSRAATGGTQAASLDAASRFRAAAQPKSAWPDRLLP